MEFYNNILETIGDTPLVKVNKLYPDCPAQIFIKVETFNPGHSIKDRMAVKMVEDAVASGKLKPGGTIIECTSGNTGMGLALVAAIKGYKCIFTTSDKQSKSKFDMLKALGAEVIVCPTNVEASDPRSYYSVAERLSKEIPNSYWFNQYDNLSNRRAHYETTAPEIWEQTDGKVTDTVVGVGTGGTISGTSKFLKEQNPAIKSYGIDAYGSIFKKYHETGIFDESEIYPYLTEGIGEDIIPKNVDFSLIDHFEKVTDKDGALWARKLARTEGLLLGYSAGSAMAGVHQLQDRFTAESIVVVIIHDHGSRYLSSIYNDDWMRSRGFLDKSMKVQDILEIKNNEEFIAVKKSDSIHEVLRKMKERDISQLPVMENDIIVGSINENKVLNAILENSGYADEIKIGELMQAPFPTVTLDTAISDLKHYFDKNIYAVITEDRTGKKHIITQYDLINAV